MPADLANAGAATTRADRIAAEVAAARMRGDPVTDAEVLAQYPDLAAELRDALSFAGLLAPSSADLPRPPSAATDWLPELTDEELEAPIELPDPGVTPQLDGYDLSGEVGRGGQGVVYRAVERATGRTVAVKVLPGGPFADVRARRRFARETRILLRLRCPGVVVASGYGRTADGSLYLVTPFINGLHLDAHVATLAADDRALAALFAAVADVVHSVHAQGIVHRDLKPSNVLIDDRGEPHLLDFGMAASDVGADLTRTLTRPDQVLGTLMWASPEQVRGHAVAVDARSDVYSIGVMLCRACAAGGVPPYAVDRPADEVIRQVVHARPRVVGRSRRDPLAAIALRCLAKRPADRYPTAAALADDLRRVAQGVRPPRIRPPRTRATVAWLSALCAAGLLSVTTLALLVAHAHRPTGGGSPQHGAAVGRPRVTRNSIGIGFVAVAPQGHGRVVWVSVAPITAAEAARVLCRPEPSVKSPAHLTWAETTLFCHLLSGDEGRDYRVATAPEVASVDTTLGIKATQDGDGREWLLGDVVAPDERRPFHVAFLHKE